MNLTSLICCQTTLNATFSGTFAGCTFNGKYEESLWDSEPRLAESLSPQNQPRDYESGFHYYGARYYWSEVLTGWLSVDPLTDDFPYISPYNYCEQNPVKLVDPDGEGPVLFVVGALVGAAVDIGGQIASSVLEGDDLNQAWDNINWTSVGISAVEGAITSGGSAVKQVVKTTAKNTVVKAASKTAAKKAAAKATSTKGVDVVAATGRAVSDTKEGKGTLAENLITEAVGTTAGKGLTKAIKGVKGPKLTSNNAVVQKARTKKGGHLPSKEACNVINANRARNQTKLNRSNTVRSVSTKALSAASSVGSKAAQGSYNKNKQD